MKSLMVAVFVILAAHEGLVSGYRVVCVYTNWAQYRMDSGRFVPEDIDPFLCTHIIYVYAKLVRNKLSPAEWNDESTSTNDGMYDRVTSLKLTNPDLKILLGVGGWKMGSKDFSRLSSRRNWRDRFANTTVDFLRSRNFDGLVIDWQHPTKRGGRRQDKVNFSRLLAALRAAFDFEEQLPEKDPLLLVAGVSAEKQTIDAAYEVEKVANLTDFLNVMAYDFHGSWENFTGHPSQLYRRDEERGPTAMYNVDSIMKYWVSKGAIKSKLNVGISTYGRSFTLRNPRQNGYLAPAKGPGMAADFTQTEGMIAYYERCNMYFDAKRVWNRDSRVPHWIAGDQWIGGDDTESVKEKVIWMRYHGFGGMMLASLDMDDFTGWFCDEGEYPLLNTINTQLLAPLPITFRPPPPTTTTTTMTMTTTTIPTTPDTTMAFFEQPQPQPDPRRTTATNLNSNIEQKLPPTITPHNKLSTRTIQPGPPESTRTRTETQSNTQSQQITAVPKRSESPLPSKPMSQLNFIHELLGLLKRSSVSIPELSAILSSSSAGRRSMFQKPSTAPPVPSPSLLFPPPPAPIPAPPTVRTLQQIPPRKLHIGIGFEVPNDMPDIAPPRNHETPTNTKGIFTRGQSSQPKRIPAPPRRVTKPVVKWFDLRELGFIMD